MGPGTIAPASASTAFNNSSGASGDPTWTEWLGNLFLKGSDVARGVPSGTTEREKTIEALKTMSPDAVFAEIAKDVPQLQKMDQDISRNFPDFKKNLQAALIANPALIGHLKTNKDPLSTRLEAVGGAYEDLKKDDPAGIRSGLGAVTGLKPLVKGIDEELQEMAKQGAAYDMAKFDKRLKDESEKARRDLARIKDLPQRDLFEEAANQPQIKEEIIKGLNGAAPSFRNFMSMFSNGANGFGTLFDNLMKQSAQGIAESDLTDTEKKYAAFPLGILNMIKEMFTDPNSPLAALGKVFMVIAEKVGGSVLNDSMIMGNGNQVAAMTSDYDRPRPEKEPGAKAQPYGPQQQHV